MVSQAPFYRHLFLPQTQLPKVGISLSDQTVDLNIRPLTLWLYLLWDAFMIRIANTVWYQKKKFMAMQSSSHNMNHLEDYSSNLKS